MDDRVLAIIRAAIGEPTEGVYTDTVIEETWQILNKNIKMTIAHFLFAKAQAITFPTAPTAPTLDTTPVDGIVVWQQKSRNQNDEFSAEVSLFREKESDARLQIETLREHGRFWLESAKDGDII